MKYTYELQEEGFTVKRTDENGNIAYIPVNENNSDYKEYLKSLDEAPTL